MPATQLIPTLVIGATLGRLFGVGLRFIFDTPAMSVFGTSGSGSGTIDPGIYALIGASAFFAGVTRMNISLCVIMVLSVLCLSSMSEALTLMCVCVCVCVCVCAYDRSRLCSWKSQTVPSNRLLLRISLSRIHSLLQNLFAHRFAVSASNYAYSRVRQRCE